MDEFADTPCVRGKCGAKTRNGHPCRAAAMRNGRCRMHGGLSLRGIESPRYRHGLYTKDTRDLRSIIALLIRESKRTD